MFYPLKMVTLGCRSMKVHVQNPAFIKAINFTLYLCSEALLCSRVQRNALAGDVMDGNVYQCKYLDLYPQTGLLSCGKFKLKCHKHLWASLYVFTLWLWSDPDCIFSNIPSPPLSWSVWLEVNRNTQLFRAERANISQFAQRIIVFHTNVVEEPTQKDILK